MMNVTQVSPTQQEANGKAFVDFAKRYLIDHTDLDTNKQYAIPVETGYTVVNLRVTNLEAWAAGGNEDLKVGDGGDDDGYIPAAAASAAKDTVMQSLLSSGAFAAGKLYTANGRIIFTVIGDGAVTAGQSVMEVIFTGYGKGPEKIEIKNLS